MISRILAQALTRTLGQSVVVDNRPGANTIVGMELVARANADGHTLILTSTTQPINAVLYPKLPYDSIRDFAPISIVASSPLLVVVHPSLPVTTVAELVAFAKAKPGQLFFPSSGPGNISHLAGELFNTMAQVQMVHVPYKGAGPRNTDLLAGRVQLVFSAAPAILPYVESRKLRAIAVTTKARSSVLPALPTVAEAGLPGYEASTWYGVLAPAHTPKTVIARLHADIVKALGFPEVRSWFAEQGLDVIGSTPEQFAAYVEAEIGKWANVIRVARITATP
jgi:tripartite-type tricarboxylate transporter receptor subunit TctC